MSNQNIANSINKKKILFFGDSLVYGESPNSDIQQNGYSFVDILKNKYPTFEIVKEGQSGRTVCSNDKVNGRNGLDVFDIVLRSNYSFDFIFIMLGTNDLKNKFNLNEKEICIQFFKYKELLDFFNSDKELKNNFNYLDTKVILISPPKIKENTIPKDWGFENTQLKSNSLSRELELISSKIGWDFIDASNVSVSEFDGIHLDSKGNLGLSEILNSYFKENLL